MRICSLSKRKMSVVRISGLNLDKMQGLFFPGDKENCP